MKNFTLNLLRLLAIVAVVFVAGNASAEEVAYKTLTFDSSNSEGVSSYTDTWYTTIDGFKWKMVNFNNNKFNNSWTYIKCGRKNTPSVAEINTNAAIDATITKVAIDLSIVSANASKVKSINLYTYSDADFSTLVETVGITKATGTQNAVLTSPAANLYYQIKFDCDGGTANGFVQVNSVTYYTEEVASVEKPTFNIESGDYIEAQTVTMSCATEGAEIYYTLDGTIPTEESTKYTTPITVAETTTITAKAFKDGNASNAATLSLTIVPTVANIKAFKLLPANSKANLTLTDAVVIAKAANGNTYIQDATGGICLYKNVPAIYEVGTVLNGAVLGTYALYNGLSELSDGDYTNVTATEGTAPAPRDIEIDDITADDYCTLVTIKNAHCDELKANAEISQDGNTGTVALYTTFMSDFPSYQNFDITGVLIYYAKGSDEIVEISPRSEDDIVEIAGEKTTTIEVVTEHSIYIGKTVHLNATVNSGATLSYETSDEAVATVSTSGIVTGVAEGTATITISAPEYDGFPAATATVTINVSEEPVVPYITLVATYDSKYYAVSCEVGDASKSLKAVEVTLEGGKVVFEEEADDNLLWIYTDNDKLMAKNGSYVKVSKGDVSLTTDESEAADWFEGDDVDYMVNGGTRALIIREYNGIYFKNYATSNIGNESYGTAAVPMEYTISSTGIETVEVENAPVVYYNLQGVRVANPESGIYIRVQGNRVSKVLVK